MRVISGQFRGKRLVAPEGKTTRPTTDRIKETIFNILASKDCIESARVLDLFAGSGAMGIEALSRGAKSCIFIEKNSDSAAAVTKNLKNVGVEAQLFRTDYRVALERLKEPFDLIFLDPPYASGLEEDAAEKIFRFKLLSPKGIIVVEHCKENNLISLSDCFIIDTRNCGSTSISFLTLKGQA